MFKYVQEYDLLQCSFVRLWGFFLHALSVCLFFKREKKKFCNVVVVVYVAFHNVFQWPLHVCNMQQHHRHHHHLQLSPFVFGAKKKRRNKNLE